jgi:hypothetical protein
MSWSTLPGLSGTPPGHFLEGPYFFPQLPMPKVDGDSRSRDVAEPGRDAASTPRAEPANVKPAVHTIQDDIPPVHVLEAAQNQDRKETEDLLAGFDRPGRGPKPASKERDFVDYYAKKKGSGIDSGSSRPTSSAPPGPVRAKQADVSTVIVQRKTEGMPGWVLWAAAALMLVFGGIVAYLATGDARPTATVPTAPSSATTITSALSPQQTNPDNGIPPPAPADPTATTTTTAPVMVVEPSPTAAPVAAPVPVAAPRGSARRDLRNGSNGAPGAATAGSSALRGTNATDDTKPPPRDDFIRDL